MENRCIQDTKQCSKRHFFGKRGVFLGEGDFEGEKKDKKKSARFYRTLLLFFVVYDV